MFGDRFNRSWAIAKETYGVLRSNPSLAIFPLLSGIAVVIVSIPFVLLLAFAGFKHGQQQPNFGVAHYATTAAMYFCNYFVIIFFNSALVACAHENLQGRTTSFAFGFQAAMNRLPQILGWTLIASTVGMVLRTIGERTGFIGAIVTSLIGVAWNIAVFFVVPCLILDRESPVAALKKSTAMLKQTWGERIILGIGVGSAMSIVFLIAIIPFLFAAFFAVQQIFALAILFAIVGLVTILAASILSSAITTIYQTALYVYCTTGSVPGAFQPDAFQDAFRQKPASRLFGQ